jgi:UDP-N-acetylmuramyl pentapeptide phosphotransferase/UDP-N-acetylglucosamine-1-phosphate transferase
MWFINLYNFMDGIDGISGVETISIGAGAALTAALAGGPLAWQVMAGGLALAAAGAGFLTMNWHPARVFLGDAGSIPLGFLGGGLLIALAAGGQPAAALILPAYYLVDATVTLVRRLLRGEKVWLPHKSHAYQAAHQAGLAHDAICRRIMLCNVLLAVLAVLSIWQPLAALAAAYFAAFAVYGWLLRGNVG